MNLHLKITLLRPKKAEHRRCALDAHFLTLTDGGVVFLAVVEVGDWVGGGLEAVVLAVFFD